MVAFLIGGATVLPALSYFCMTTGVCIFFVMIFQVILFVPFLAIDEKRRAAGRNDFLCCWQTCCCECCICSGKPTDINQINPNGTEEPVATWNDRRNCLGCKVGLIKRCLRWLSGPLIRTVWGNILAVAAFIVVLTVGIIGFVSLQYDSDFDRFFPEGSYALDYIDADDRYFNTIGVIACEFARAAAALMAWLDAFVRNPSYWDKTSQMTALRSSMMANSYIVSSSVRSWEYAFQQWAVSNTVSVATEADYYTQLNTYLASSDGSQYRDDVIFTDNSASGSTSNPITISRIPCNQIWMKNSDDQVLITVKRVMRVQVKGMDSFRGTVDQYDTTLSGSEGDPFGYSPVYPSYEGFKVVEEARHAL